MHEEVPVSKHDPTSGEPAGEHPDGHRGCDEDVHASRGLGSEGLRPKPAIELYGYFFHK